MHSQDYRDFVSSCEDNAAEILRIDGLREETIVKALEQTPSTVIVWRSACLEKLNEPARARVYKAFERATDSVQLAALLMRHYTNDLEKYGHHLIPIVRTTAARGNNRDIQDSMALMLEFFVMDDPNLPDKLSRCHITDEAMLEIIQIFSAHGFWVNLSFISNTEQFSEAVRQAARTALVQMEPPKMEFGIIDCTTRRTIVIPIRKETNPKRRN
jgi:hypothetical protein